MNYALWHTHPLLAWASMAPVPLGVLWLALGFRWSERTRRVAVPLTWLATRVAFAVLLWGVLGHEGTDQLDFFLPQARKAMAGALPYRDFATTFAPLFPPLLGAAMRLLGSAGPIALFLVADGVALLALVAGLGAGSAAAWAYAAWPPVWYLAVRYAQDEPLSAMFLALAWLAGRRGRWALAGAILGLGLVSTKLLFVFLVLPLALASGNRWPRLVAGFAAPVVLVYGAFLALGAPVWEPFQLEGGYFGVGPTLWRLPAVWWGWRLGFAGWLPCLALMALGAVLLARRGAPASDHAVWQYGAFAALTPKFMVMYVIPWAPLLVLWAAASVPGRRWLLVYGFVLPLAWYIESGPLQGWFGPAVQAGAAVATLVVALLPLVPLAALLRGNVSDARAA